MKRGELKTYKCPGCGKDRKLRPEELPLHCSCRMVSCLRDGELTPVVKEVRHNGRPDPPELRSKEEVEKIVATYCRECPHYLDERCTHRGCYGCRNPEKIDWLAYVRKPIAECPIGFWGKDAQELDHCTIGVTAYRRPDSLARLLASIKEFYPDWPVLVEYTGGNLSEGRNRIVQQAETEAVCIVEDDFEFTERTDLRAMLDVLRVRGVGVVCGALEVRGEVQRYATDLRLNGAILEAVEPPAGGVQVTPGGTPYQVCDMGWNFIVTRRRVVEKAPWDQALELNEHAAWFASVKRLGVFKVAFTPSSIVRHHQDRPEGYQQQRNRSVGFKKEMHQRHGFHTVQHLQQGAAERPNLIIMSPGEFGAGKVVRMLEKLGWYVGDADEHGELPAFRALNDLIRKKGALSHERAAEMLGVMPEPWVLRGQRLAETLREWMFLLSSRQPTLVVLGRSEERLKGEERERNVECRRAYESWPWGRAWVDFDDLEAAAWVMSSGPERVPSWEE